MFLMFPPKTYKKIVERLDAILNSLPDIDEREDSSLRMKIKELKKRVLRLQSRALSKARAERSGD